MLRSLLLGSLLLTAACGDPARIGLEADGLDDRTGTAGYTPSGRGDRLLAVRVTILNGTDETVPLSASAFFLEPASGASVVGHPVTVDLGDGCAGALAPDRTVMCAVAFEVPAGFTPVQIAFEHRGQRAIAAVSFAVPDAGPSGFDAGPPPPPDAGPGRDAGFDAGTPPDAGVDAGPPLPATQTLDLLFMVDNSNSMTEEQVSLAEELPRLMRILGSGDFDEDGSTDGPEDFTPFQLHVGVITSDMGTGGFTVPTCPRSDFGDDGILRTQGRVDVAGCMATYPSFLTFRPGGGTTADAFAQDVACVSLVGTGGCGFEQQLEAILKALSPSAPTPWTAAGYVPPTFHAATFGHADTVNDGFVREGSVLAIVPVTDEEDCSAFDPDLFNPSSVVYGSTDLNLRCFAHGATAVHPIDRFVDGLLQLRTHPRRLVYAPIAGIPIDLEPGPGEAPDWELLVSDDPSVRDDRMQEQIDPAMPSRLLPSCNAVGRGVAFPPVRIVQVARELERGGAHVALGSICQESLAGAIRELIRAVRDSARRG